MRIETLLLAPGVAGGVAGLPEIDELAKSARRIEEFGFDGATTPEAGHDPFLPLMIAAEHTKRITLGTNVATKVLLRLIQCSFRAGDKNAAPLSTIHGIYLMDGVGGCARACKEIQHQVVWASRNANDFFDQPRRLRCRKADVVQNGAKLQVCF